VQPFSNAASLLTSCREMMHSQKVATRYPEDSTMIKSLLLDTHWISPCKQSSTAITHTYTHVSYSIYRKTWRQTTVLPISTNRAVLWILLCQINEKEEEEAGTN